MVIPTLESWPITMPLRKGRGSGHLWSSYAGEEAAAHGGEGLMRDSRKQHRRTWRRTREPAAPLTPTNVMVTPDPT